MESLSIYLQPFFEWLLRTTLQASLMVCLILLLQRILRSKLSIRWHYCLWLLLLVRMMMPWSPQSSVSLFNLIPQSVSHLQTEYIREEAEAESVSLDVASVPTGESKTTSTITVAQDNPKPVTATPSISPEVNNWFRSGFPELMNVLPIVWLVGALALAVYICVSNFNLWRIVKHRHPLTDQKILDLLEDCKDQLGIQTILGIVPTDKAKSPALFGFIRPRLLLPQGMIETLSQDELRYILLHELAHLKRHDIYIGWLMSVLQILHWFNPLVWLAFYLMRSDRELACDALVLARTQSGRAKDYGRIIVSLVERFSHSRPLPVMAGILENKSQLKRRITMIAKYNKNSYQWSPLAVILIILLASVSLPDAISTKASQTSAKESIPPIMLRRIWAGPDVDCYGAPSPDGRYLSFVDWETSDLNHNDLAIYEIATGKKRSLTDNASWYESDKYQFALSSIWSPDGKQIAYQWWSNVIELCVIGIDGSKPRILYGSEEWEWVRPYDWTPDGRQILACVAGKDGKNRIMLVSAADGSVRVLKTLDKYYGLRDSSWYTPKNMSFSPDGRYIVYDFPQKEDSHDISLMSTDGSREIPLVEHPASDYVLGWAPDGKNVIFASDRTGTVRMWLIAVADGKPRGVPELVKADIGRFGPMGLTEDGSFYYSHNPSPNKNDVYVTKIDPETGKIVVPPHEAVKRYIESNTTPDYSPDSKYLAYISRRPPPMKMLGATTPLGNVLCIRSLETGEEREFKLEINSFGFPQWSPDSRSIMVVNFEDDNKNMGLYRIDAQTGKVELVVMSEDNNRFYGHLWCADGRSIFIVRGVLAGDQDKHFCQIVVRDIESGVENELYRGGRSDIFSISLSPDGKWLAFLDKAQNRILRIMPAVGGEPREIHVFDKEDNRYTPHTWTADGKYILMPKFRPPKSDGKWDLWRIPVDDGEPQNFGFEMASILQLSAHPDGQHIAFCTTTPKPAEVWVMENFLPEAAVAKPTQRPNFTKIQIPTGISWDMRLSPDGRRISLVSDKKLWIMPATGQLAPNIPGEPVELGTGGVLVDRAAHTWSADGKWIAFNEEASLDNNEGKGNSSIYVIPSEGGTPKKVYETYRDHRTVNYRISLSPNARTVAFSSVDIERKEQHIYTIPVDGGIPKRLVDMQAREPVFSSDGSMIAFVEDGDIGRSGGGLWVVPAQGGTPKHISDAINASSPIWSPDGDMIAFLDYGEKKEHINCIRVTRDGNVLGEKIQIDTPEGIQGVWLLAGWSPDNQIGAVFERSPESGLYTIPAEGGKAMQVTYGGGQPRWSPDGERIFCVKALKGDKSSWQGLAVGSFPGDGGRITTVPLRSEAKIGLPGFGAGARVSPDGTRIVFSGKSNRKPPIFMHNHIWTVPVEGGTPTQVTEVTEENISDMFPCWSPDGNYIAYVHARFPDKVVTVSDVKANIYIIRQEEGTPTALTTEFDGVCFGPIAWSPDGEHIAYYSQVDETTTTGIFKIVSAKGHGESRIIGKVDQPHPGKEFAWSPDSKRIAFNGSDGKTISIMSVEDGMTVNIETGLVNADVGPQLDWSSDGKRFVFAGGKGESSEFWMIQNFLPTIVASDGK